MDSVPKTAIAIARKLREYRGGLTSKDLNATYIEVYPLIERKLVKVTSMYGVPIYVLTETGIQWLDELPNRGQRARQKE